MKKRLYDFGTPLFLLLFYFVGTQYAADTGRPIDCTKNPKVTCEFKVNQ